MSVTAAEGMARTSSAPPEDQVLLAATVFGLLADPNRLRIVHRLAAGETDVAGLAKAAGCSATAASQHLARLRLAGLAMRSRNGRRVVYRLRDPRLLDLLHAVFPTDEGSKQAASEISSAPAGTS